MKITEEKALSLLSNVKFKNDIVRDKAKELLIAISKVPRTYLVEYNVTKKQDKEHLERVFAYELYYQWHAIIGDEEYGPRLNAELNKKCKEWSERNIMPDMVLHGGQGNGYNQWIVCEIKRKRCTANDARKDLLRLIKMTHCSNYQYHLGVFIFATDNNDNNDLLDIFLKGYKEDNRFLSGISDLNSQINLEFDRILCVSYDGDNIKTFTLTEIMNEYNNTML